MGIYVLQLVVANLPGENNFTRIANKLMTKFVKT